MVIYWYYRNLQQMTTAVGMRKSNRKPSTFQKRHIALFVFDNSLGHACKAKEPWLGTGNKVMKRLQGNFHMLHHGTSWTERLTKRCIREKKVKSYFEEREQYEANLQQETLVVLEWSKAPVADL
ncbi:hypothetical protein V8E54_000614 [Elaphomyces granulatus]